MGCSLDVQTEPYHPAYFLINGRSMPDLMDPNYASEYPHQPYNGNPHMHPGELTLIRTIGQGRWQHPFHEHANHVRILARDGNLILSPTNPTTQSRRHSDVQHRYHSGRGVRRHLLLQRQGIELGPVRSPPGGHRYHEALSTILAISESGTTVTATVNASLPPGAVSAPAVIAGAPTGYDGTFALTSVTPLGPYTITAISEAGTKVTATVTGTLPAALVNTTVAIAGVPTANYNGSFIVTSVTPGPTTSTFTYTDTHGVWPQGQRWRRRRRSTSARSPMPTRRPVWPPGRAGRRQ